MSKAAFRSDVRFFFSSRRRHTRSLRDWSSDVCSSDLPGGEWGLTAPPGAEPAAGACAAAGGLPGELAVAARITITKPATAARTAASAALTTIATVRARRGPPRARRTAGRGDARRLPGGVPRCLAEVDISPSWSSAAFCRVLDSTVDVIERLRSYPGVYLGEPLLTEAARLLIRRTGAPSPPGRAAPPAGSPAPGPGRRRADSPAPRRRPPPRTTAPGSHPRPGHAPGRPRP